MLKDLTKLTLQKKVSLFLLLGLGISLGVFSQVGIQATQQSTERTLQERLSTARLVANYIDAMMQHALHDLESVAREIELAAPV